MLHRTAVIAAACLVSSCAGSPLSIYNLDAREIQRVADADLCYALAIGMEQQRSMPNVRPEVSRRRLNCSQDIEEQVSNCSKLRIVNPRNPVSRAFNQSGQEYYIGKYRVLNSSDKPMNFRITFDLAITQLQRIEANTRADHEIPIPPYSRGLAGVGTGRVVATATPLLQECKVVRGYGGGGERGKEIPWK